MKIKGLIEEDFINYKKPSMFIIMPYCSFKCDFECGRAICQNSSLKNEPIINIPTEDIIKRYLENPISEAVVLGGLEPFDSWDELLEFVVKFREHSDDEIVIYTGYKEEEIESKVALLRCYSGSLIIKYGRFIPNSESKYDELLGIELASQNQYSKYYK